MRNVSYIKLFQTNDTRLGYHRLSNSETLKGYSYYVSDEDFHLESMLEPFGYSAGDSLKMLNISPTDWLLTVLGYNSTSTLADFEADLKKDYKTNQGILDALSAPVKVGKSKDTAEVLAFISKVQSLGLTSKKVELLNGLGKVLVDETLTESDTDLMVKVLYEAINRSKDPDGLCLLLKKNI